MIQPLYNLGLAARSFRRDRGFTAVMVVTLALSVSLFVTAMAACRRIASVQAAQPRFPGIYRVQERTNPLVPFYPNDQFANYAAFGSYFVSRSQVRLLSGSGIPEADSPSFLAGLWGGAAGGPAGPVAVRFCRADLFRMFGLAFRYGAPWRDGSGGDADAGDVVVLNDVLNDRLFDGRDSVGRSMILEGRSLRVVGVLAVPASPTTPWDFNPLEDRGQLLVPFDRADALRPMPVVAFPPTLPASWEELSDTSHRFIEYWVSLPDQPQRDRFAAWLAAVGADREVGPVSIDRSNPDFDKIPPPYVLFLGFTGAVVLANVLNVVRLLLAKAMARSAEIGIHRALGASRKAIFVRQLMEGTLVVLAGSIVGVVLGVPTIALFDRLIPDLPSRLILDPPTAAVSLLVCVLLSLAAGFYPAWRIASVPPTRYLGRI